MPVFVGAKYQHGHGLGNIFSGLFCSILYRLSKKCTELVVKTGLNLVHDASHGVASHGVLFKQSVKKHVPIALKEVVEIVKFQSGSGAPKSKHRRVNSHRHQRRRHCGGGCGSGRRRRQHFNGIIA